MGKYNKKHEWHPCEFVYSRACSGKNPGDTCSKPARMSYDGKYYCFYHKPPRMQSIRTSEKRRKVEHLKIQRERLKKRMLDLGVELTDTAVNTFEPPGMCRRVAETLHLVKPNIP